MHDLTKLMSLDFNDELSICEPVVLWADVKDHFQPETSHEALISAEPGELYPLALDFCNCIHHVACCICTLENI